MLKVVKAAVMRCPVCGAGLVAVVQPTKAQDKVGLACPNAMDEWVFNADTGEVEREKPGPHGWPEVTYVGGSDTVQDAELLPLAA
jgi:hypothetical protein